MMPFEALYGKKCDTPMSQDNLVGKAITRPNFLKEMEKHMIRIRHNLKATQDRNKIYANKNKVFRYFKVGEHVFLKVKAKRSSIRLGCYPILAARDCGLFEILEKIGPVEYMLVFPACITCVIIK
jgi:hypothetical protein